MLVDEIQQGCPGLDVKGPIPSLPPLFHLPPFLREDILEVAMRAWTNISIAWRWARAIDAQSLFSTTS
jgi:hypothetical protein